MRILLADHESNVRYTLRSVCDDLYVIVLSERPEAYQAILEIGANAFVSKMESPERLLAAITD